MSDQRDVRGTLSPSEDFRCCDDPSDHAHEFFMDDEGHLVVSPPTTTEQARDTLSMLASMIEHGEFDE